KSQHQKFLETAERSETEYSFVEQGPSRGFDQRGFDHRSILKGLMVPVTIGFSTVIILIFCAFAWQRLGYPGLPMQKTYSLKGLTSHAVLAAKDYTPTFAIKVNVPSFFGKGAQFLDSVSIKKGLSVTGLSQLNGGVKTN